MKKSDYLNLIEQLKNNDLFKMFSEDELKEILNTYNVQVGKYEKGELIFSKKSKAENIGIILKGFAQVSKGEDTHKVVMSRLDGGDMFGLAYLFSKDDYFVTDIMAGSECKVAFLSKEMIRFLLNNKNGFAEKYISYLSGRIYFLNDRIESFTSPTAKDRVLKYIEDKSDENGECRLNISLTTLAKVMDIGRASLYRAIDELEGEGKIMRKDSKTIIIRRN